MSSTVFQTGHNGLSQEHSGDTVEVIASPSGRVTEDQGHSLAAEASLVEMTELDYTHLQHIFQTQMDAHAAESYGSEAKFQPTVFGLGSLPAQPAAIKHDAGSVVISLTPTIQAIDLSTSNNEMAAVSNASTQETVDMQEMKRVLDGNGDIKEEKTPTTYGEVPGSVLDKVKNEDIVSQADNGNEPWLTRLHSSARVCLEKRFNCMPCSIPTQDTQPIVLSNFLSMLQQSPEAQEAAISPQTQKLMRSDHTNPIELSNPFGMFNPFAGKSGQEIGPISHGEPNKHQGLLIPKNFSFSFCNPEGFATKGQCITCIKSLGEHQRVKGENTPPLKYMRARGSRNLKAANAVLDSKGTAGEAEGSTGNRGGHPLEQRRENHNSKERDRRKRIRLCCDELNMLVPFCNKETDKATTLRWTSTFLKYLNEEYGDSLKQEFESTFCVRTGLRLKPSEVPAIKEMAEKSALLAMEQ